jgi:hypothetical protein
MHLFTGVSDRPQFRHSFGNRRKWMSTRICNPALGTVAAILLFPSFLPISKAQQLTPNRARVGATENIQVHSGALENNKLGDPADQPVAIYLPPGYKVSPRAAISHPLLATRIRQQYSLMDQSRLSRHESADRRHSSK